VGTTKELRTPRVPVGIACGTVRSPLAASRSATAPRAADTGGGAGEAVVVAAGGEASEVPVEASVVAEVTGGDVVSALSPSLPHPVATSRLRATTVVVSARKTRRAKPLRGAGTAGQAT
jgi:hypothetical protein